MSKPVSTVYFLLEEPSMEAFLNGLLPRLGWSQDLFFYKLIPHHGKHDLQKSLPRKLRGLSQLPGKRYFVVIQDQDRDDCYQLKRKLQSLIEAEYLPVTVFRIACRELESWFLGDLRAVSQTYGLNQIAALQQKSKFRNPDKLRNPSGLLKELVPAYQKTDGARRISQNIEPSMNCSNSFQVLLRTLQGLCVECQN